MDVKKPKISVITATYNVEKYLPKLIESLRSQTDKDFEWVVADGASTDGTLDLLKQITDLNIVIISQVDFGIYDALNRGVKHSTGDYYVVAGADDYFFENAIADFRQAAMTGVDLITAPMSYSGRVCYPTGRSPWLYGMRAYVANHSISSLIKTDLHDRCGYYSNKLSIAADNLFILKVMKSGATLHKLDNVVGYFSADGVSNTDTAGALVENFRSQLMVGSNKYIQLILLFLRLLKHIRKY